VDLTIAIEEEFSADAEFEIRDEDAENIRTVQDIMDFLATQGLT
jgi:acyl carrier protein